MSAGKRKCEHPRIDIWLVWNPFPVGTCAMCGARGVAVVGASNDDYPQHAADLARARVIASQERVAKTARGRSR